MLVEVSLNCCGDNFSDFILTKDADKRGGDAWIALSTMGGLLIPYNLALSIETLDINLLVPA